MKHSILIIDDETKLRTLLQRILAVEGFKVFEAPDLKTGQIVNQTQLPSIILCDVKLPDGNGLDFITPLKKQNSNAEIIMLTAYGNISDGVQAIKNGAYDYLTKGDDNVRIIPLIQRALEKISLKQKVAQLESKIQSKIEFDTIIGDSTAFKKAVAMAKKVATTDTTILLTGETGTGKEVFAQAIHNESPRQNHKFIAINCAAFSKELLESELFGHVAGAFTGAIKSHVGFFEQAHNGTLFLDEIGELPIDLQAKLLRVLEIGTFNKIGDQQTTQVDVRIIAATNRNLTEEISLKNFREDLYFRLSVFQISLPSLQERKEDIPLLATYFVKKLSEKFGGQIFKIHASYLKALSEHHWKGNIRELKNTIERSIILAEKNILEKENLHFITAPYQHSSLENSSLFEAEKAHILKVLNKQNGNKTKAAEILGIALTTLYRKLQEIGFTQ